MSNLSLAECQAIQHVWKDRAFQYGDRIYYQGFEVIHKGIILDDYSGGSIVIHIKMSGASIYNIKKIDLTLIPDTKLMSEALPNELISKDKSKQIYLSVSKIGDKFAVQYNKYFQGKFYDNHIDYYSKDIDKALQQMHVYLKENKLMEVR